MRGIAILLVLLVPLVGLGAAEDLVARAAERQAAAEADLAAGRAARLAERSEQAAARTAATRELAELGQRRRELERRLAAQTTELAATRQRVRQRELVADQLRDALTTVYGVETTDAVAAVVDAMVARLVAATRVRIERERVIDRAGHPAEVPVLRLGAAAALAAGAAAATAGLLLEEADATPRVAGPPLGAQRRSALTTVAGGGAAAIALDVSGGLATREAPEPWSVGAWVEDGGIFAWPIILVTLLALIITGERAISLSRLGTSGALAERTLATLREQGCEAAAALVEKGSTPMARVLRAGLALFGAERERLEAGLEAALLSEEPRFERSLTLLAACAAVAPLLGLLGTVTGMIGTFEVIAVHGTGNPRLLSGGISEALVTTQMGLLAAVPILLCHAALSRVVDRRQVRLEQAATALVACREEPA